jgi:hypothetical protein
VKNPVSLPRFFIGKLRTVANRSFYGTDFFAGRSVGLRLGVFLGRQAVFRKKKRRRARFFPPVNGYEIEQISTTRA